MMLSIQRRFLFPRQLVQPRPNAGEGLPGLKRILVESPEGSVESWYFAGDDVSARKPAPAVIFAHGNAELIDYWPEELAPYRRMGINLMLPEYRGYGRSAGAPSQEKITSDFKAFYDALVDRPEVDAERVFFHGRSLGGGAVCALAAERRPAALILQSTFTSVRAMARRFLLPGFLVQDPFDNEAVVSALEVPILIVHCRQDELVPFRQAEALARAAKDGRLVAFQGGHNDCPPSGREYWVEIRRFLAESGLV